MRLVSVVLGTASEDARISASRKLINFGFRFYDTVELYTSNEPLTRMRIWKGAEEEIPLGLAEGLFVTLPRGKREQLDASMTVDTEIMAPAHKGEKYGTVDIKLGEEVISSRPLVALRDIPEGSLWQRMVDSVLLLFN